MKKIKYGKKIENKSLSYITPKDCWMYRQKEFRQIVLGKKHAD
jgi:hypothetical protein